MATEKTLETPVYLSEYQLQNFVKFQKNLALFILLEKHGALDLTNATVSIHFNPEGKVGSVDVLRHFRY